MAKISLRKSEVKELNEKIGSFGISLSKNDKVEVVDDKIILVNNRPAFFYHEGKIVPALKLVLEKPLAIKKITVDMGAVRFVASGADIMRPGIVMIEDGILQGDIVCVIDVNNKKPLAIGLALFDSSEMKSVVSGKAVKSLHYVGDRLWKEEF